MTLTQSEKGMKVHDSTCRWKGFVEQVWNLEWKSDIQ